MSRSGIRSIVVNAAYLSTARFVTSATRGLYAIVLAKWLGAEMYGLINYGLSWYLLLMPLATWGVDAILIREVGRDRSGAPRFLGQTLALRVVTGVSISALSVVLAVFLEPDPTSRTLLFVFSGALIGRTFAVWANAVFKAYESSGFVLGLELVFRLLEVITGITLLLLGFGVIEIAIVHAAGWLLQGVCGYLLVRRRLNRAQMCWDKPDAWLWIRRGLPILCAGLFLTWLLQGPILFYRHLEGISDVLGQLALALQGLYIIGAVISEAGVAALPVLARSVDRGDGKSDLYVDLVLRAGAVASALFAIFAITIGPALIDLLLGSSYAMTASLLPWTLLLIAPYFWGYALSSMVIAHGRNWSVMVNKALGAIAFTLAFPVLVSEFDAFGVVLALALGLCSASIAHVATLRRSHNVSFLKVIGRSMAVLVIAVVLTQQLNEVVSPWLALFTGVGALSMTTIALGVIRFSEINRALRVLRKR